MKNLFLALAGLVLIGSGIFMLYFNWQDNSDLGKPVVINIPVVDNSADEIIVDENDVSENADNLDQLDWPEISDPLDISAFDEPGIWLDQEIIVADENALYVSGQANTFEGNVGFSLYGDDGVLIQEDFTTADRPGAGKIGDFEKVMSFAAPLPHIVNGYLEVYAEDPMLGAKENLVVVPVYFAYNDTTELTVYFSHSAPAGMPGECMYLQTVSRFVMGTLAPAKATMQSMLLGPKTAEEANGFFSGIPSGTKLNSIYIENRIVYVDFSIELNSTAGSCGIAGVTAMIRENLLQFATIDDVVISVEGQTEDILQP